MVYLMPAEELVLVRFRPLFATESGDLVCDPCSPGPPAADTTPIRAADLPAFAEASCASCGALAAVLA